MQRQHVIIVGAGAAGLIAAARIAEKCDVTIVEKNERTGGRIRTFSLKSGNGIVEGGAEFVHGDTPVTNKLITEAGLEKIKLEGKMLRKEGKKWNEEEDMIEGWDELIKKMKGQRKDVTMQDFLEEHFPGDKYADLRRHIRAFVQGFDVADVEEVSVQSLYREWSNEAEQFRVLNGYGAIVQFLEQKCRENGCEIVTGETVRQIDWQKNEVTIYTSSGKKINGNKVIITIPVSVLRNISGSASVNFTPPIDEYINAAGQIGYGTVVKVIFDLKEKLWKNKTGFIFSNEMIPTWWTQFPVENKIITGWAGGPVASKICQHTDDELFEIGIKSLSEIFEIPLSELRNIVVSSFVFNWRKYDEALGAYSYSTPHSASARKLLNTPLADTVYFAGEGFYEGEYSGTVEAALNSGRAIAEKLIKTIF